MHWLPLLAACKFAVAVGPLAGIEWPLLGIAAAIGIVFYFAGALAAHVRVGDFKELALAGRAVFRSATGARNRNAGLARRTSSPEPAEAKLHHG
jgi:hypothetical protein